MSAITFIELSAKTGMAIDDIAQASTIFYQQGLDDAAVKILIDCFVSEIEAIDSGDYISAVAEAVDTLRENIKEAAEVEH